MGESYFARGDFSKAISIYNELIQLAPDSSGAFRRRADAYRKQKEYERAIDDYNHAIDLDIGNGYAFSGRGRTFFKMGNLKQAIADLECAINVEPEDALAYGYAWEAYLAQGEDKRARIMYHKAIERATQDKSYYWNLVYAARRLRQFDLALEACKQLEKIDPDYGNLHNALGYLYIQQGDLLNAKLQLERALELDPNSPHEMLNLGITKWRLGQNDAAKSLFKKALRSYNEKRRHDGIRYRDLEGWLETTLGNVESGLAKIRSFLKEYSDINALYNLLDWTQAILAGDAIPPDGMDKILQMVKEELDRSTS